MILLPLLAFLTTAQAAICKTTVDTEPTRRYVQAAGSFYDTEGPNDFGQLRSVSVRQIGWNDLIFVSTAEAYTIGIVIETGETSNLGMATVKTWFRVGKRGKIKRISQEIFMEDGRYVRQRGHCIDAQLIVERVARTLTTTRL
jgi:hypothetical protein